MASMKDVEQVATDLENLVRQFREELEDGPDFEKLVEISDEISEHADDAASTFSSINEELTSRIGQLNDGKRAGTSRSGGGERE
jgi:hypothetical protein